MSDLAQGFIVMGAPRTRVQRWLGARRLPAFLAAGPGKVLRVWPVVEGEAAEEAASALTGALPKARVLALATGEESLRLGVHADGSCRTREEVALRLRTAKQLARAHAALQRVATALEFKGRLPTLLRDGPSRTAFLSLAGVAEDDMASLHHRYLADARRHPGAAGAARLQDLVFLDEEGRAHRFFLSEASPGTSHGEG